MHTAPLSLLACMSSSIRGSITMPKTTNALAVIMAKIRIINWFDDIWLLQR